MTVPSFIKSSRGKVIIATVVALHFVVYAAKPGLFKTEQKTAVASPPNYLPDQ